MAQALVTVVEVEPFPATAAKAGLDDEARQAIAVHVAQHPLDGVFIPGTGGLRKLRWGGTTGGKRGGYRVVYYFFSMDFPLYLLAVYAKSQQIDLTPAQRERLSRLSAALKSTARAAVQRRRMS